MAKTRREDVIFSVEENNPVYRLFFGARTPSRRRAPASEIEILLGWGLLLIVSAALYIHLDVSPFLPIHFSPPVADILKLLAFLGLGVSLAMPLGVILLLAYESLVFYARRALRGPGCIVCAECGNCTPVFRYMKHQDGRLLVSGCRKCGSFRVYCAKCGKSAHIKHFIDGDGCPYCGYPYFLARKT